MKRLQDYAWPVIGLVAVVVSVWLLYNELRSISLEDIIDSLSAISARNWLLAADAAALAYVSLAAYDWIALLHLRKRISWLFIAVASFTTYALAHNIGASVFSGAVVRYRAYSSQGLTGAEIGVLVALCSLTFALAVLLLGGLVLVIEPELAQRINDEVSTGLARVAGFAMLAVVGLYVIGSALHFRPLRFGSCEIAYPRLPVVARQLVAGPLEIIGAAGIIYFALPEAGNPGFIIVLGIFLASFSVALMSHAPGGLGVLELLFLTGLPELDPADVMAALIVFRVLYLLIPFAISLVVILIFERSQFARRGRV
jgi:uncharacterized membrane protein YbhN (UPF0104 family)